MSGWLIALIVVSILLHVFSFVSYIMARSDYGYALKCRSYPSLTESFSEKVDAVIKQRYSDRFDEGVTDQMIQAAIDKHIRSFELEEFREISKEMLEEKIVYEAVSAVVKTKLPQIIKGLDTQLISNAVALKTAGVLMRGESNGSHDTLELNRFN